MKDYRIIVFFIIASNFSCNLIFRKNEYPNVNRPQICSKVFDNNSFDFDTLKSYSVNQLITLQKCGLKYHPQFQLQSYIVNQDEYPTPELVKYLQIEQNEDFLFHLILDFATLTKSEKHKEKLLADKDLVITEIDETIQKMQDKNLKKISEIEFNKIKKFYNGN